VQEGAFNHNVKAQGMPEAADNAGCGWRSPSRWTAPGRPETLKAYLRGLPVASPTRTYLQDQVGSSGSSDRHLQRPPVADASSGRPTPSAAGSSSHKTSRPFALFADKKNKF